MGTKKKPQSIGAIPCPFCGSIKLSFISEVDPGERVHEFVTCTSCNSDGPGSPTKIGAVTRWNMYRAIQLCTRMSKVGGLFGNTANTHKTDPKGAHGFLLECAEQARTVYHKCCEDWGKPLTDDIIEYVNETVMSKAS